MPAPTWNDIYQPWVAAHKAQFGGQDMNRDWNRDDDARAQKAALDKQYLDALAAYSAQTGEQASPDQSVLGTGAQPNSFTETDHSHDGFFGPVAKSLGMSTNDLGSLAALAAGGYGLYSSGLLGGAASAAAPASYSAEAVLSGAAPGAASMGAAGGSGLLSTLGGAASTAGKFLKDNPLLGQLGGAALGALAGGDSTTSTSKDPWAPAQPYLKANLERNQGMQDYYAANPFSDQQKTAYQGLLDTLQNNQANAPVMQGIANSFMGSNRGLLSGMPQFTQGAKAPVIDWSKYANIGVRG